MVLFCVQQWLQLLSWWYDLYDVTTLKTIVSAVDVDVLCLASIAYSCYFVLCLYDPDDDVDDF